LYYDLTGPDESFRNPALLAVNGDRSTGGLWLPRVTGTNPTGIWFSTIVPMLYPDFKSLSLTGPPTQSNYLFNINDNFTNGQKFEFLFRFEGIPNADPNLFVARLDAPPGVIPSRWWESVRPFHFNVINTRPQRGGVTILNNVIDPTAGDFTYIRYHMLRPGRVTVQVFTLDGTLVRNLRRNYSHTHVGEFSVAWDGRNERGNPVARGMYFVRVVGPDVDEIRRIMVVRR
jgi:hypothetical protein